MEFKQNLKRTGLQTFITNILLAIVIIHHPYNFHIQKIMLQYQYRNNLFVRIQSHYTGDERAHHRGHRIHLLSSASHSSLQTTQIHTS